MYTKHPPSAPTSKTDIRGHFCEGPTGGVYPFGCGQFWSVTPAHTGLRWSILTLPHSVKIMHVSPMCSVCPVLVNDAEWRACVAWQTAHHCRIAGPVGGLGSGDCSIELRHAGQATPVGNWVTSPGLTLLVVDADDHGERGAEGYDPTDRVGPGPLAVLDLHPAVHIVPCNKEFLLLCQAIHHPPACRGPAARHPATPASCPSYTSRARTQSSPAHPNLFNSCTSCTTDTCSNVIFAPSLFGTPLSIFCNQNKCLKYLSKKLSGILHCTINRQPCCYQHREPVNSNRICCD